MSIENDDVAQNSSSTDDWWEKRRDDMRKFVEKDSRQRGDVRKSVMDLFSGLGSYSDVESKWRAFEHASSVSVDLGWIVDGAIGPPVDAFNDACSNVAITGVCLRLITGVVVILDDRKRRSVKKFRDANRRSSLLSTTFDLVAYEKSPSSRREKSSSVRLC